MSRRTGKEVLRGEDVGTNERTAWPIQAMRSQGLSVRLLASKGIPGLNALPIYVDLERRALSLTCEISVKDNSEVVSYSLCVPLETRARATSVWILKCVDAIEAVPEDDGTRMVPQRLDERDWGLLDPELLQDPRVGGGNAIEIPSPDVDSRSHGGAACHGQATALRQRCRLEPQSEPAQLLGTVRPAAAVAHGFVQLTSRHTGSVIRDADPRPGTVEVEGDLDPLGACVDAVVDQVSYRRRQVVPDVPQRVHQASGGGNELSHRLRLPRQVPAAPRRRPRSRLRKRRPTDTRGTSARVRGTADSRVHRTRR